MSLRSPSSPPPPTPLPRSAAPRQPHALPKPPGAPFAGHSRLVGHPQVPATSQQLAHPVYYIVKLRDGRPGVVAAADHTRVWVPSHATAAPLQHHEFHSPLWWNQLLEAIRPTAGFVLYSEDADTKSLEDPGRYVRKGYVYNSIDITWLKRAMDMSMDAWTKPELKTREQEKLLNWLLRLSKNAVASYGKAKDTGGAVTAISEALHHDPEVKLVVYSGRKTSLAQVDSMRRVPLAKAATASGAGYERVRNGPAYDSVWVTKHYKGSKLIGRLVAPPR